MQDNGGYILHLDALGGTGGDRLLTGLDSISNIVLNNSKIQSENSIFIKTFLEEIKTNFGEPLAVVQDMGRGIMKAVEEVFPNVKILICHFHFLRDLGKDLLKDTHDIINKRIQFFKVRVKLREIAKDLNLIYDTNILNKTNYKHYDFLSNFYLIIEWILDWKSNSNGYGFPFDRQYYDLSLRIINGTQSLNELSLLSKELKDSDIKLFNIYEKAEKLLCAISSDEEMLGAINIFKKDIEIFDNLRNAMRIAPLENGKGLNDPGDDDIKLIEINVMTFLKKIKKNALFLKSKKGKTFLKQINKYKTKLFSDPIKVITSSGVKKLIQPQRTNNIMEQRFRKLTRDNKRKTGDDSIKRTIQGMVKDTPLIQNWQNEEYRKLILGESKSLIDVFAEIDVKIIRDKMSDLKEANNKIPNKIKKILQSNKNNDKLILTIKM